MILAALQRNPLFMSAALPLRVFPPLFNRYQGGQSFGNHVDNAIRQVTGTPHRDPHGSLGDALLREPGRVRRRRAGRRGHLRRAQREAAGRAHGALSVDQPAPRAAGDAAAHASRRSSGFRAWSATTAQRTLLFDLDIAIQRVARDVPDHPSAVQLTGVYHNLIRRWADA